MKPASGGGTGFFSSLISSLSGVAEESSEAENGAHAVGDEDGGAGDAAHAPVWASDATSNECSLCRAEFTWLRRRHHCRRCGLLVCDDCSKVCGRDRRAQDAIMSAKIQCDDLLQPKPGIRSHR